MVSPVFIIKQSRPRFLSSFVLVTNRGLFSNSGFLSVCCDMSILTSKGVWRGSCGAAPACGLVAPLLGFSSGTFEPSRWSGCPAVTGVIRGIQPPLGVSGLSGPQCAGLDVPDSFLARGAQQEQGAEEGRGRRKEYTGGSHRLTCDACGSDGAEAGPAFPPLSESLCLGVACVYPYKPVYLLQL